MKILGLVTCLMLLISEKENIFSYRGTGLFLFNWGQVISNARNLSFTFIFILLFTQLFPIRVKTKKILSGNLVNLKCFSTQKELNCHKLVNFCHIMLCHMFQDQPNIHISTPYVPVNGLMVWKTSWANGLTTVFQSFLVHRCSIGTLILKRNRHSAESLAVQTSHLMIVNSKRWKKSFNFSKSIMLSFRKKSSMPKVL